MPIVIKNSMFCYSVGRLISNQTNVGFNFVKVYGGV